MTGAEALVYARSRHGSTDFDRASRQQRVILSLRQQADFATLLQRLPDLVKSTKKAVKTDFPVARLPQLIDLASRIDVGNVRSYVFTPPRYGTRGHGQRAVRAPGRRAGDPRGRRQRLHLRSSRRGRPPGHRRGGRPGLGRHQHGRARQGHGPGRLSRVPGLRRVGAPRAQSRDGRADDGRDRLQRGGDPLPGDDRRAGGPLQGHRHAGGGRQGGHGHPGRAGHARRRPTALPEPAPGGAALSRRGRASPSVRRPARCRGRCRSSGP